LLSFQPVDMIPWGAPVTYGAKTSGKSNFNSFIHCYYDSAKRSELCITKCDHSDLEIHLTCNKLMHFAESGTLAGKKGSY